MTCSHCNNEVTGTECQCVTLRRDLANCWREQTSRRGKGGGGCDGLSLQPDRPMGDESIVWQSSRETNPLRIVLRVTRVEATSEEMRQALHDWLLDRPSEEEVADLLWLLKEIRRARPGKEDE